MMAEYGSQLRRITIFSLIVGLLLIPFHFAVAEQKEKKDNLKPLSVEDVQRFSTAISHIKRFYVKPTDDSTLFENAIRGMLSGLDPHSSYLNTSEFKELQTSTKGQFGGLGIEVTLEKGIIKVIAPIDDTPAFKAGIKPGDYIIRLDGKPVRNMTLRDAVSIMRGKKGSKIILTVLRKNEKKPLKFTIVRDVIHIKSVKSKMFSGNFAYVRVSHFQTSTAKDFKTQLTKLLKKSGGNLNGLILDLRNNPGGLLDSAIELSDLLIHNDQKGDEETIVYTKGRIPGSEFTAVAKPVPSDVPFGSINTRNHHRVRNLVIENIKIPKKTETGISSLKESDLRGHFENNNGKKKGKKGPAQEETDLIYTDYQLYRALDLLHGLTLMKKYS